MADGLTIVPQPQDDIDKRLSVLEAIPPDWQGSPRLAIFFIPAPTPLALSDGSTIELERDENVPWLQGVARAPTGDVAPRLPTLGEPGRNFVSLRVWRIDEAVESGIAGFKLAARAFQRMQGDHAFGDFISLDTLKGNITPNNQACVFEAITPLLATSRAGVVDVKLSISDAFDRVVEALAELYRAYTNQSGDWRVRPPHRRTLSPVIPFTTRHPFMNDVRGIGIFIVNIGEADVRLAHSNLTNDEIEKMVAMIARDRKAGSLGDPVMTWVLHARRAQRALYLDCDFESSVIWQHAAAETLFDVMLLLSLWEEGLEIHEAAEIFRPSLRTKLRTIYASRFGGTWDASARNTPIARFMRHIADIRNRVIHASYQPTEEEAKLGLVVGSEIEEFIKGRLVAKRYVYPRTALMILGEPGLQRRDAWSKRMAEQTEEVLDEPDWMSQFGPWAAEVRAAVRP